MMNTNLIYNFGQTILDSYSESVKKKLKFKLEAKDPEENQIVETYEGECEQCDQEKLKKPCTICGE